MYYAFSIRCSLFIAILVLSLFGGENAYAAGDIGCKTLLADAIKAGERPAVYYAKDWGIIHIQTSHEKCIEPVEVWNARHLRWKVIELAKGAVPPAIKSVGGQSSATKNTLPGTQLPKAELIFSPPHIPGGPSYSANCNRKLGDFWFQGGYLIKGQFYWLSDVYTIDHDGNGIVDNIGFRLKSPSIPDINIRYFAAKGKIQGAYIAKLKLVSDKVIPWICFARISFAAPPKIEQPNKLFNRPNLARDIVAKSKPGTEAKKSAKNKSAKNKIKKSQSKGLMFWILIGLGVLIIGGGGAFWLIKSRHGSGDEDEDEEDEDMDD